MSVSVHPARFAAMTARAPLFRHFRNDELIAQVIRIKRAREADACRVQPLTN